mgnify:CR=1 FL=1
MVNKQKILIVDDDNNIAELISLYLTKECFETLIVNDYLSSSESASSTVLPSRLISVEMEYDLDIFNLPEFVRCILPVDYSYGE